MSRLRWLARQFAKPEGAAGRLLIGPWLDRISGRMNALVLAELDPKPGDAVLEVGFGGGALLRSILARGAREVIGADISAAMVARARRRSRREPRLSIVAASAEALPLADRSVDKAAAVNTLYFWPDPATAFAELARVLRPGGRLAVAFEPPDELAKWPGHVHGFRMFGEEEVRTLMGAAGFAPIRSAWGTGWRPDRFLCLTGERAGAEAG